MKLNKLPRVSHIVKFILISNVDFAKPKDQTFVSLVDKILW